MASNKTTLGILFIMSGLAYGSLMFDRVYDNTLGFLVQHQWLRPPVAGQPQKNLLGRKTAIFFYSLSMIIIGVFILWNRET